jgi:fatty acid desaturase
VFYAINEQTAIDMEVGRSTRQDAIAVATALAVAAVLWAFVEFGFGWSVLGATVFVLLLAWLVFYLEQRELQRTSEQWDLRCERTEADTSESPQPRDTRQ